MTNNRIKWIDMAKGIGMIAIVLSHIRVGIITKWLFTFHVPLFFFLSGFVFNPNRKFSDFLKRKAKSIVVPYFCLGLPLVVCIALVGYFFGDIIKDNFGYDIVINGFDDVWRLLLKFVLQQRMWTIWFLTCLFCMNIIFYFCAKYIHSDVVLAVMSVILPVLGLLYYKFGGQPLVWNLDICFTAFPFMFCGYYLKKNYACVENYVKSKGIENYLMLALLIINIFAGYMSYKLSNQMFEMYASAYGIPVLSYISAFSGIGFIIILSQKFNWKPVCYIGSNSMIFLAWHHVIMIPVSAGILSLLQFSLARATEFGLFGIVVYKLLQLVLVLLLCTASNEIIIKLKLKFMLGR